MSDLHPEQAGRESPPPGPARSTSADMANIAVQRIKREFKEVVKSEEVGDLVEINPSGRSRSFLPSDEEEGGGGVNVKWLF